MMDLSELEQCFRALLPAVEFCSLRRVHTISEHLAVRRGVVQPVHRSEDQGVMVTVYDGGLGYAATADLSPTGLRAAINTARTWAQASAGHSLIAPGMLNHAPISGEYTSLVQQPWSGLSTADKLMLLRRESERLKTDERIVDWQASLWRQVQHSDYLSSDAARLSQLSERILPSLSVTAQANGETQSRSFGGHAHLRQGGLEILEHSGFYEAASQITEQALQLLQAPNCPDDHLDVVLASDQMILQIHESIGHPLELDRILGDERNYAGTSFVTPDMFGRYQYGSPLLNITFDPTLSGEAASYAYDDEGSPAQREYLIKDGILLRALGGVLSQRRAQLPGVANARANNWNRPPIDRMANLNLEPGIASLSELIGRVERGVYMQTNRSWSIDDSRNKFQFGCEWGQLIENGELTQVIKNPNYRGVSAKFWRSLTGVGSADERQLLGTPYCGKGEPNQVVAVGHASPPCLFRDVAVFGGE